MSHKGGSSSDEITSLLETKWEYGSGLQPLSITSFHWKKPCFSCFLHIFRGVRKDMCLGSNCGSADTWQLATLQQHSHASRPCKRSAPVGNSSYCHYGLLSEMQMVV